MHLASKMANNSVKNLCFHIQKRFLQSCPVLDSVPSLPTSGISLSSVEYLVNSCGLPSKSALFVSQKFQLHEKNPKRVQSLLDFFKSHNFSDTQVAQLINRRPQLLQCKIEGNLRPKFDYLIENGFVGKLLPQLILSSPGILKGSLDSQIKPCFEFLRSVLHIDEKIVTALKRGTWLLSSYTLKGELQSNIDFLTKEGVSAHNIGKLLTWQPRTILQKHDRIVYAVNAVKNLGFEPTTSVFIQALRAMLQLSESSFKDKIEMMKSMGWDEEDIYLAFRREPLCLTCSEEKVNKAMDFYVNTLKLDPRTVIAHPQLLRFSIEKRICPRFNVLKVLESKKLIEGIKNIWWLRMSEKNFLMRYVDKYIDEVPNLLELYLVSKGIKQTGS